MREFSTLLLLIVLSSALDSQDMACAQDAAQASEQRVQRLIERLGAPSYTEREQALSELVELGRDILPLLRQARNARHVQDDPEIAWRLERVLQLIAPGDDFRSILLQLAHDELDVGQAVQRLHPLVGSLPATVTPQPPWTLEILQQIQAIEQRREGNPQHDSIAFLNFFLLLCEAGGHNPRIQQRAIKLLQDGGDHRGYRLAAILTLVSATGSPSAEAIATAATLWQKGTNGKGEDDIYLDYEIGMYALYRGQRDEALAALERAIKAQPMHRDEAHKSSDYYPLRQDPAFRKLLGLDQPR
jgi:tetratricopeptide (TPR) repeat protein